MYDIFLSYATKDRERVQPLFEALTKQGWTVFWDHLSIRVGKNWSVELEQAINASRCVVVAWSEHSIKSEYVREEANFAKRRGVLLPICLDKIEPPFGFTLRQATDFSQWNQKTDHPAFIRIASEVSVLLNAGQTPPPFVPMLAPKAKLRWPLYAGVTFVALAVAGSYQFLPKLDQALEQRQAELLNEQPKTLKPEAVVAPTAMPKPEPTSASTPSYVLKLELSPATANVKLDSQPYVAGTALLAGEYALSVEAKGYQSHHQIVQLEADTLLAINLKPVLLPYGLEMIEIISTGKTGKFMMGCDPQRDHVEGGCEDDEKPVHAVTLPPFSLSKTEVTVGQFRAFVEAVGVKGNENCQWHNPSFKQTDNHPVVCVSWADAQAYLQWLNARIKPEQPFRLPTEAEWEYAARGGTKTAYPWGHTIGVKQANCDSASCKDAYEYTAPVGSFPANPYGLQDMQGNVWEWVQDWYAEDYYRSSSASAPRGSDSGPDRVLRGGSWGRRGQSLRSADRGNRMPDDRRNYIGFRLAQSH